MSIRSAAIYSTINQLVLKVIGLISVILFARLLTPEEMGVYAVAATIAYVATEFRSLGTGSYLIREKEVPTQVQQACLGLSLLMSWGIGASLFIFSDSISLYFMQKDLELLIELLAICFFLAPYTVVPFAMLSRNMEYKIIAVVAISAQLITFIVTLLFVLEGYSYFSMAYGLVIGELFRVILYALLSKNYMRWIPSFRDLSPIVKSGLSVSIANMLKRFSLMSSDLVIGRLGNARDVAIYSRGVGFLDFVSSVTSMGVNNVALSYISDANRKGENTSTAYIRSTNVLLSLTWPVMAAAAFASLPVIRLFFGDQWDDAAPLLLGLTVWFIFIMSHSLSHSIFITLKKENTRLIKELIMFLLTVGAIAYFYSFGLLAVSWSMAGVGLIDFILSLYLLNKTCKLSVSQFLISLIPNIILTVICGLTSYCLGTVIDYQQSAAYIPVLILACVLPVVWFITMKLLKLELYTEIMSLLGKLLPSKAN